MLSTKAHADKNNLHEKDWNDLLKLNVLEIQATAADVCLIECVVSSKHVLIQCVPE